MRDHHGTCRRAVRDANLLFRLRDHCNGAPHGIKHLRGGYGYNGIPPDSMTSRVHSNCARERERNRERERERARESERERERERETEREREREREKEREREREREGGKEGRREGGKANTITRDSHATELDRHAKNKTMTGTTPNSSGGFDDWGWENDMRFGAAGCESGPHNTSLSARNPRRTSAEVCRLCQARTHLATSGHLYLYLSLSLSASLPLETNT